LFSSAKLAKKGWLPSSEISPDFFPSKKCLPDSTKNEYTNGLIRQYIPKKQTFTNLNDNEIKRFQTKINRRPRKLFSFEAPKDRFFEKLH
jgi:IS30 family transposase